jgi:hypothetical protein
VPWSAFAAVRWDDLELLAGSTSHQNATLLLGIRGYFGTGTLLDNDRYGAPMDVLPFPVLYGMNLG